jgi:acyl carrier protein
MIEERGVKRLMLMSRRPLAQIEQPSNPEYEEWLRLHQAKKEHDAHIDVVQADVTKFEDVRNLIEQLASTSYPVRGIIHGAVVEEDRSLAKLSRENLIKVLGAKAHGAWNLHRASQLPGASVHFFLLFSSIRNHLIYLASGGYNAGNQFLDILARYRAEQGLPALSISLPAVSGAGMFHRNRDMLLGLQRITGFELVPTIGVFELIERFHVDQMKSPCPIIFAANWQKLNEDRNILVTEQLRKIVIRQHAATSNLETSTGSSKQSGVSGSMNNSLENMIEQTQRTVARLLGASSFDQISIDRSLISQGMDSLAAVSLYNWLGQETNIFIPLSDLLQGFSIQMIAEHVYKKLNNEKQTDVTSNEDVLDSYLESMAENQTEILTSLHYTGTDNIVCVRRPIHGKSPIFFCILPNFTTNDSSLLEARVDKLFKTHDKVPPAGIYTFQMPQLSASKDVGKNAGEIISHMRRIQPQGPYALLATNDDQGESLAREIMKELKTHSLDCVVQSFSK